MFNKKILLVVSVLFFAAAVAFTASSALADKNYNSSISNSKMSLVANLGFDAGDDEFQVDNAGFNVQLLANFFGPGSEPFEDTVTCEGEDDGSADTIIKRLDDVSLPRPHSKDTVPIEIVALNLTSCQPITVSYGEGNSQEQEWDVQIELSQTPLLQGHMTIERTWAFGGTFDVSLPVNVKLTFTPSDEHPDDTTIDSPLYPGEPIDGDGEYGNTFDTEILSMDLTGGPFSWHLCWEDDGLSFCPDEVSLQNNGSWMTLTPLHLNGVCEPGDNDCNGWTTPCGPPDRNNDCNGWTTPCGPPDRDNDCNGHEE